MDEDQIKTAAGLSVLLLFIPMLTFIAVPNIFFGYENSGNENVARMTQQAMALGGVYTGLEDFENSYMDHIVAGIVAEYEDQGIAIDEVELDGEFDENDLNWLIAISSVAYRQDLDAMSVQDIRAICTFSITREYTLLEGQTNVLKVTVRHLEPERLGFDDEKRTWAGAIYEVLSGSGAIEKYAPYFEQYRPDYINDLE